MKEAHQPIISNQEFDQVQEEIKRRRNIELVDQKLKGKIHITVQRE